MKWKTPELLPFGLVAHGDCAEGVSASVGCLQGTTPGSYTCVDGESVLAACAEGGIVVPSCNNGNVPTIGCNAGDTYNST